MTSDLRQYGLSAFTVLRGTALAQIVYFLVLPILTRIYSPDDFGNYHLYTVTLNILLMVVSLRYEIASLTVKSGIEFHALSVVILCLCLTVSIGLSAVIVLNYASLIEYFNVSASILWMLPLALFIAGMHQFFTFFPIREQNYLVAGRSKLLQSVGFSSGALLFSPVLAGIGLVVADIVGRIVSSVGILRASKLDVRRKNTPSNDSRGAYIKILVEHKKSPLLIFPGTLLSASVPAIVAIILATQFSLGTAGQYALVERFLVVPSGMLAVAVSQVITGDFTKAIRSGSGHVQKEFRHLVAALSIIALLGGTVAWFVLPKLVAVLFGDSWAEAGQLAKYSVPYIVAILMASPMNMLLLTSGFVKTQLSWEILRFVAVLAIFFVMEKTDAYTATDVVLIFSIASFALYFLFLILVDRCLGLVDANAQSKV